MELLLWGIDLADFDPVVHQEFVMERVMSRGSRAAMRWLRESYGTDNLARFLTTRGDRIPPRDRAYWKLIANLPADDEPGGARPKWAGA